MPKIRSSADLRNNYNEISTFCHDYAEPVFITKNGKGDLAVFGDEHRDLRGPDSPVRFVCEIAGRSG